eukprot:TRINITY_DN79776_c0_g1_i1.p1 TRINITY_DN79776_c0_g1~~TRINITY_DN79776_c0_g1_i1.p1  ORF type:complete len:319 (+),score=62.53 TRINITY_DN79776_c0_g1_i1:119-1075(+)
MAPALRVNAACAQLVRQATRRSDFWRQGATLAGLISKGPSGSDHSPCQNAQLLGMRGKSMPNSWDPLGQALLDHFMRVERGSPGLQTEPLLYWTNLSPGQAEELPMELFFRGPSDMPALERHALELCRSKGGHVLDIGAGAGSHVLALLKLGLAAEGMDISSAAVELMRRRGVIAQQGSFWQLQDLKRFDTLMMLMNTAGLVGSLEHLGHFLKLLRTAVNPHCQLLLDVSPPDWDAIHKATRRRSGQQRLLMSSFQDKQWAVLSCWLSYGSLTGRSFPMLFAEPSAAVSVSQLSGWKVHLAYQDPQSRHTLLQMLPLQ